MKQLSELLERASAAPPPPGFDVTRIVRTEDRRRHRRRLAAGGGTAAAVAVVVGALAVPSGDRQRAEPAGPTGGHASSARAHPSRTPGSAPSRSPGGSVTEPPRHATARLRAVTVDALQRAAPQATSSWVALYQGRHDAPFTYYGSQGGYKAAGILNDRAGKSYLFIDVNPGAGVYPYTCTDAPGSCTRRQLADGTALTVQVDELGNGVLRYAVNAQRADGTAIDLMEENYSEHDQPPSKATDPHAQRTKPTLSTDALVGIVQVLTLYPKGYPAGAAQPTRGIGRPPGSAGPQG
ncbi:hypothetical protein Athai_32110 [Actinocatenispora thailandica]|uniref:Uncharacterized protein n=1 Tax=Actinocatenispora thailandica TaxID=227318 RepID=A0A7R7HY46_9ACTN|nr:hypothetical protein [Actinocatenispora thailandica]BCJ35708.1 hypothetical protein Athai_32110 [Actinocatenispora thailandica]